MPSEERCPKNPSMPKAYCSHCQGTERGTVSNPKFSIRASYFEGCPVVEVLKDGGPVHKYDDHFRFGIRKAQMLLACVEVLREFWQSTEEQRLAFKPRLIEDQRTRLQVSIFVEMHPDFEYSTGQTVDRPWLRLKVLSFDKEHIGLGMIKCRAVCAVKEDLQRWLKKEGAFIPEVNRQIVLGVE